MRKKGKAIGLNFDLTIVDEVYHALQQGRPVSPSQVQALDKIVQGYYITKWQTKYYPAMRGTAPLPDLVPDLVTSRSAGCEHGLQLSS
jgi:hypothetical protein